MPEHILFLTGKLAEKSLHKVLESMQPTEFTYDVRQIGISVAGLMTSDLVRRRVTDVGQATQILVPGRCRGDLEDLGLHYGIPVLRGPEELKDIPQFFGRAGKAADLSRYDVLIFAEIVEATQLDIPGILARAQRYRDDGADVIDLGCLPNTPFPHLEEAVQELHRNGFRVSIDSVEPADLKRGGAAGADYLLSLKEDTLWLADEVASTPVLIPTQAGDLDSLGARHRGDGAKRARVFRRFDPGPDSLRLHRLHRPVRRTAQAVSRCADHDGGRQSHGAHRGRHDGDQRDAHGHRVGAACERDSHHRSEPPCAHRRARGRFRAAGDVRRPRRRELPKGYSGGLATTHERKPFPDTAAEIAELASAIKDPSYRIQVSDVGMHLYNRDGLFTGKDPFELYPHIRVDGDEGHAFYLGVELARAQIAWQLGKRYTQDSELDWGAAVRRRAEDLRSFKSAGTTLSHKLRTKT